MGKMNELFQFQIAVERLAMAIRGASALWQDKNYEQLSRSIAHLGNQSRAVIEAGNRCQKSIDEFERIANENY